MTWDCDAFERTVRRTLQARYGHLPFAMLRSVAHEKGFKPLGASRETLAFACAWEHVHSIVTTW